MVKLISVKVYQSYEEGRYYNKQHCSIIVAAEGTVISNLPRIEPHQAYNKLGSHPDREEDIGEAPEINSNEDSLNQGEIQES